MIAAFEFCKYPNKWFLDARFFSETVLPIDAVNGITCSVEKYVALLTG